MEMVSEVGLRTTLITLFVQSTVQLAHTVVILVLRPPLVTMLPQQVCTILNVTQVPTNLTAIRLLVFLHPPVITYLILAQSHKLDVQQELTILITVLRIFQIVCW